MPALRVSSMQKNTGPKAGRASQGKCSSLMVRFCVLEPKNCESASLSKGLKGSCRNLCMRGHMVENVAQTMESDVVNYLKRQCDLMVKLKGVVVLHSHLVLYSNLRCIVLVFVGCESDNRNQKKRLCRSNWKARTVQTAKPF